MKNSTSQLFVLLMLSMFLFTSCNPVKVYSKMQMKKSDLYEGSFKSLDGATINFADNKKKSKETILFLNGFMMDRMNFFSLASKFRKEDYRLVLIDLPGGAFGKSSKEPNLDYSLFAQAERIKEIIVHLGIDKVHLVGTSMGGGISIELNTLLPNVVIDNTLIAPFGMPINSEEPTKYMKYLAKNADDMTQDDLFKNKNISMVLYSATNIRYPRPLIALMSKVFKENKAVLIKTGSSFIYDFAEIRRMVKENQEIKDILLKQGFDSSEERLPLLFSDFRKTKNHKPFLSIAPSLEKIENPILVIWGEKDHIINYKTMDSMKPFIKNGRYVLIKNGSHAISSMRSKRIAKEMKKTFLKN